MREVTGYGNAVQPVANVARPTAACTTSIMARARNAEQPRARSARRARLSPREARGLRPCVVHRAGATSSSCGEHFNADLFPR